MNSLLYPFWIVLAAFCWALDTLIRYPLMAEGFSAPMIVFFEHAFLMLFALPVLIKHFRLWGNLTLKQVFWFLIIGGAGSGLATILFTQAFVLLNPSTVILLQKFQPILTIYLASLILKEKISLFYWPFFVVGFVGVLLLSFPDFFRQFPSDLNRDVFVQFFSGKLMLGVLFSLGSVVIWSLSTVLGKNLGTLPPDFIAAGRFFCAFLFLFPLMVMMESNRPEVIEMVQGEFSFMAKVFLLSILSGVLGMVFYYKGLKHIPAHFAVIYELFFPLFAVVLQWIFYRVTLQPLQIVGALLLITSSIGVQLSQLKKDKLK